MFDAFNCYSAQGRETVDAEGREVVNGWAKDLKVLDLPRFRYASRGMTGF